MLRQLHSAGQGSGQFEQVGVFQFVAHDLEALLNIGGPCHLLWL